MFYLIGLCAIISWKGDTMRRKLIIISFLIVLFFGAFLGYLDYNTPKKIIIQKEVIDKLEIEEDINYTNVINSLKEKYQNIDVIGLIEIPNVLEEAIVQSTDNNYYLHHDINRNDNIIGATFLDYRNNIDNDKKLLIYSHSDPEGTLPFVVLNKYNDKKFFDENKYIYLVDSNKKRKYEVFSSYVETSDFDYVNLESFNGLTYKEHLEKLKNKSLVSNDVELDDNSKVLILQTCSFREEVNSNTKYQLVIAKEIE